MSEDWAWPALIQSLQNDIAHLRDAVDDMRRETSRVREAHREELDQLIDQLRAVRSELNPLVEERNAAQKAKREIFWGWIGRGGWVLLAGLAAAAWHWITRHLPE